MAEQPTDDLLVELTTHVVSRYVAHNAVPLVSLPSLIAQVHQSLAATKAQPATVLGPQMPAVPINKSIRKDHIVCLEDGKLFKSLKRHLAERHDLTPEKYRVKWALPSDYPMVAPRYSARRSDIAKEIGLGRSPTEPSQPVETPNEEG